MLLSQSEIIAGLRILRFPVHRDQRGALVAFDHNQGLPFELKRSFYLFDVPEGESRAGHAVTSELVCVALRGSIEIWSDNGRDQHTIHLDAPTEGVHVSAGVFLRIGNFSADALVTVMASETFAEVRYAAEPFYFSEKTESR